ncbi:outer membrane lipoprotein-sorting protein [bacterium]|nr:outer membrane lipoprotein-sorting protein [bacterium]
MQPILLILCVLSTTILMAQPSGQKIFDKMDAIITVENSKAVMLQTIQTTSGKTRELIYDSFSAQNGEVSLMRYIKPSRVKGNAMLMTDFSDNIWMYNKRTNRVRKLASHAKKQKFEGSDFTYEDMGSGNSWREKYTPIVDGSGKIDKTDCWKLILEAKDNDAAYSQIICWPRKTDAYPLQLDYYDENGTLQKTLYMQDIQLIEDIPTAIKMRMENHLDRSETTIEYQTITYQVTFPANFFSERNLKK